MATQAKNLDRVEAKSEVTPEISAADRAMGASMVASGIGSVVLGILIIGAETNASIKTFLTWDSGVGPLGGKTGIAVIAFLLSWVGLHYFFKSRPITLKASFVATLVLVALGLLLTFPPVFYFLSGE